MRSLFLFSKIKNQISLANNSVAEMAQEILYIVDEDVDKSNLIKEAKKIKESIKLNDFLINYGAPEEVESYQLLMNYEDLVPGSNWLLNGLNNKS